MSNEYICLELETLEKLKNSNGILEYNDKKVLLEGDVTQAGGVTENIEDLKAPNAKNGEALFIENNKVVTKDITPNAIGAIDKNKPEFSNATKFLNEIGLSPEDMVNEKSPCNTISLKVEREGLECVETWILVNAWYDKTVDRFKRINLDDFSFGWQFQAKGSYPGEVSYGDSINQGINLWKANGRNAYTNKEAKDKITEEIGLTLDGRWTEFGIELGWQNHFMNDSYGGMTVGGSGFEIDGSGMSPYKRVSLGKYSEEDGGKTVERGYNGTLWNSFHSLIGRDDENNSSLFYGFTSPIIQGNKCDLNNATFEIKKMSPGKGSKWENIYALGMDGSIEINPSNENEILIVNSTVCGAKKTDYQILFSDIKQLNKNNFEIVRAIAINSKNKAKSFPVSGTISDIGVYGWLGLDEYNQPFKSAQIEVRLKNIAPNKNISIKNTHSNDVFEIGDGELKLNNKKVLLEGEQGANTGGSSDVILKETTSPKKDELYVKKVTGGACTGIDKDGYFILNGTTASTFEVTKAGTIGIKVECLVETPNVYYSFNKYNGESIQPWTFSIKEYAYAFNKGDKFVINLSVNTPVTWKFKFINVEDTKICLRTDKDIMLATMDDIKNKAGKEGPEGPEGPKGENGASAYQIAAKNGYKGTEAEWIVSLKGVAGPAGATPTEIDWSKVINKTFDFEQTYISNADMFIKNGYAKTNSDTLKLPPGLAAWGVIQGVFENLGNHTGIQYWYPCSGVKKGRVFIRMIETAVPTEWIEVATMKDLANIQNQSSGGATKLTIKPNSDPLPYEPYLEIVEPGAYGKMNTSTYDMPTLVPGAFFVNVSKAGAFKIIGKHDGSAIQKFELAVSDNGEKDIININFNENFEHIINLKGCNENNLMITGSSASNGWSVKLIPYRYETIAMNTETEKLTFTREDEDLKNKTQQLQAQVQQLTSVLNTILPEIYDAKIQKEIEKMKNGK